MPSKKKRSRTVVDNRNSDEIFEKAYIYYRRNLNNETLNEIAKGDNEPRFLELKAQVLYRMERCEEALDLYKKLIEVYHDDFDDIRQANMIAIVALMESKGISQNITPQLNNFEQIYNYACILIEKKEFAQALKLLDEAIIKCRTTLTADGLTEKEIQEELAIIQTQKAFTLQSLGQNAEAEKIYEQIEAAQINDTNIKATVFNNNLVIKSVREPNLAANSRNQLRTISLKNKYHLSLLQKKAVLFNLALLKLRPAAEKEAFQEIVTGKINRRKRKRKTKLPKNYDPNVAPDPERWLPRQERSAYRKKLNKKFKDRDIGRGTQGVASNAQSSSTMDFNKAPSVEPHPSPKPTPEGPRVQRPTGGQQAKKNKKKKGGKW